MIWQDIHSDQRCPCQRMAPFACYRTGFGVCRCRHQNSNVSQDAFACSHVATCLLPFGPIDQHTMWVSLINMIITFTSPLPFSSLLHLAIKFKGSKQITTLFGTTFVTCVFISKLENFSVLLFFFFLFLFFLFILLQFEWKSRLSTG